MNQQGLSQSGSCGGLQGGQIRPSLVTPSLLRCKNFECDWGNGGRRVVAAKALAITAADLFADAQLVADAKADFRKQLNGATYQSVVPEFQKPPLDYRRK
jgi:hypothetical protein